MLEQLSASSCLANTDSQSGALFLLLINSLFASQCELGNPNLYPPDSGPSLQDGDHFDFIVIGAGSAGSVVGTRLTEVGKWKVLVLEAGHTPSMTSDIPLVFFNVELTDQIWDYHTEPSNTSCLGLKNGACHWPRGKLYGGCSSINAMLYMRGNKQNFDDWVNDGNEGWDYETALKYYKRSEKLVAPNLQHLTSFGKDGLLVLSQYQNGDAIRDAILKSGEELGYKTLEEDGPSGFFESLVTIKDGVRANVAKMFLGSVKNSDKIKLAANAHVNKIIVDKELKQAKGVEVVIAGKTLKLHADKEVILSAGSLNSPQVLMLSGIGPQAHLQEHGIEVIKDLNVGENLQDHMIYILTAKLGDKAMESTVLQDELYKYFSHREGMFSNVGITNIQAFMNTKKYSEYPDIQFTYITIAKNDTMRLGTMLHLINMNPEVSENWMNLNKKHHMLFTFVILIQPKSRGRVLLRSKNPSDHPIFQTGYLTDKDNEDIETMVRGIRIAEAQIKTEALKKMEAEINDPGIPNCKKFKFDSDDYWKCAVRNIGTTLYHPAGSNKMGPSSDKSAVVDPRLRVHGVKNLRVIDASIMPKILSANLNGPTIMIGQHGAQMIIDDHTTDS